MLNTTHKITRPVRQVLALTVAAIAVAASMSALAAPAEAYSTSTSGYTGYTEVPVTYGVTPYGGNNTIFMGARKVCTTNGYRASQDIYARYRLFRWSSSSQSWVKRGERTHSIRLGRDSCASIQGVEFGPSEYNGTYNVDVKFWWYKAGGSVLGSKYIDYDGNDYACWNNTERCRTTGNGWIFLESI